MKGGRFMGMKMIYDNVFRTMVEKTPELIVHLINEVFKTDYDPKEAVLQSRNEHETEKGEVITDSVFVIRGITYHIECQAYDDSSMAIRMVEYDFLVALEQAEKSDGVYRMKFPESCVLYIRKQRVKKPTLDVELVFPSGETVMYQAKVIPTLSYTLEDIFDRKLYALLPYYILKYEKRFDEIENSDEKREALLNEYATISDKLIDVIENNAGESFVGTIINLLTKIVDEILADKQKIRKGIGDIMGGRVLHLAVDDIRAESLAEGLTKGEQVGMSKLANAIQELKSGKSVEEVAQKYGQDTADLAAACK